MIVGARLGTTRIRRAGLAAVLIASSASAQPLSEIKDEPQLTEVIAQITQDPAIKVDDPDARAAARVLLAEGVRRVQQQAHGPALASFLEAYDRLPSPKILLVIASTLRDLGRLADAANTYRRYLADPGSGSVGEVKDELRKLDRELAMLTVHVLPRGSELSIDAGPYVLVGSSLQLRVRPGPHAIRIRSGTLEAQLDITTFQGESKDVAASLEVAEPRPRQAPEHVDGWLIDRVYATTDASSRERHLLESFSGVEVKAVPHEAVAADPAPPPVAADDDDRIRAGVIALVRIDGIHFRGFAGGLGITWAASDPFEVELTGLKSDVWGAYVGARYRFLAGSLRPYLAGGLPVFFFQDDTGQAQVAFGGRVAAGVELELTDHVSVQADLGVEHFFNVGGVVYKMQTFEETAFAPTLGVIGRL